jgi:hypothetical protein
MKKVSTAGAQASRNISRQKLTVGLDVGDRNSWYCVLDEGGQIQLEQRVRTSAKALHEVFGGMPRSRIALETGTHSPWISRLLGELGHEVIVANARKLRLIGGSRKKRRSSGCTDAGPAGPHRSAVAESGEASQPAGTSGRGGDSCPRRPGAGAHGAGEHGPRTGPSRTASDCAAATCAT